MIDEYLATRLASFTEELAHVALEYAAFTGSDTQLLNTSLSRCL